MPPWARTLNEHVLLITVLDSTVQFCPVRCISQHVLHELALQCLRDLFMEQGMPWHVANLPLWCCFTEVELSRVGVVRS